MAESIDDAVIRDDGLEMVEGEFILPLGERSLSGFHFLRDRSSSLKRYRTWNPEEERRWPGGYEGECRIHNGASAWHRKLCTSRKEEICITRC
mgnify:CR=1 FL=1